MWLVMDSRLCGCHRQVYRTNVYYLTRGLRPPSILERQPIIHLSFGMQEPALWVDTEWYTEGNFLSHCLKSRSPTSAVCGFAGLISNLGRQMASFSAVCRGCHATWHFHLQSVTVENAKARWYWIVTVVTLESRWGNRKNTAVLSRADLSVSPVAKQTPRNTGNSSGYLSMNNSYLQYNLYVLMVGGCKTFTVSPTAVLSLVFKWCTQHSLFSGRVLTWWRQVGRHAMMFCLFVQVQFILFDPWTSV